MIRDNVSRILQQIEDICKKQGRDPKEITLVGVTKFAENDKIQQALDAGIIHIGENRVQEGERKFPHLKGNCKKHLIGHLQSNKAKLALEFFDIIESVDSLKLAQEIDKQAQKRGKPAEILVQVNTSGEEQKIGIPAAQAEELVDAIKDLEHIRVSGLMTIAPLTDDEKILRPCFRDLKDIFDSLKKKYASHPRIMMKDLSMGMSGDFPLALEEGANIVRIGSAIFK